MIQIAIIDDEAKTRNAIKQILELSKVEHTIVVETDNVADGIKQISNSKIDLALLDVEINHGTSFDILQQIDNIDFKVVFITAHQQYAINAFRYAALDYILKPIHPEKLIEAVKKTEDHLQKEEFSVKLSMFVENMNQSTDKQKKILLKTTESIHIVNVNDIVSCHSDGCYTKFYLMDGQKILVSKTIKEFEAILPDRFFLRIHHSYLINLNHLKRFDKADGGSAVMTNDQMIPVSQRKRSFLLEKLEKLG